MAKTERIEATCAVKAYSDGTPFLIFEMGSMPSLPRTYIGLDLREGTTVEAAEAVAEVINSHCKGVSALIFGPDE